MGAAFDICPATAIRQLPLEEQLDLIDQMPLPELDTFVAIQSSCLSFRESIRSAC